VKQFPDAEALRFLLGVGVSNITFQPFSIDILFDEGTILVVEHSLEYADETGRVQTLDIQKGFGPTALHRIVGGVISAVSREPFLLTIDFSNGRRLKIKSVPGGLESGHISSQGEIWVF